MFVEGAPAPPADRPPKLESVGVGVGVLVGIDASAARVSVGEASTTGASVGGASTTGASVGGASTGGASTGGSSTTGSSTTTGASVASAPAAPDRDCPGAQADIRSVRMMINEMTFKILKCVFVFIQPLLFLIAVIMPK